MQHEQMSKYDIYMLHVHLLFVMITLLVICLYHVNRFEIMIAIYGSITC